MWFLKEISGKFNIFVKKILKIINIGFGGRWMPAKFVHSFGKDGNRHYFTTRLNTIKTTMDRPRPS